MTQQAARVQTTTSPKPGTGGGGSIITIPGYFAGKIDEMSRMADGWDGYRAPKPSLRAQVRALRLLDEIAAALVCFGSDWSGLSLVPTLDGGMQFEWRRKGKDLEIWIYADGRTTALRSTDDEESDLPEHGVKAAVTWLFGR